MGARGRGREAPDGEVRISVPTTYGHHRFLPSLLRPKTARPTRAVRALIDFIVEQARAPAAEL